MRRWPKGMNRRTDANFDRQLIGRTGDLEIAGDLPLAHVTAVWPAKEIIRAGKLVTRLCDVFALKLLYFFVMRPAYVSRYSEEPSHQITRFPAVFVVDPGAVTQPVHVYPFDSGGGAKGAFQEQADKYVPLEDYALEPRLGAVKEFVAWAFGSIEAYFEGRTRLELAREIMPHESVAISYLDIARMGVDGSNVHDKRASTIEIAASHNVDLPGNLRLLIIPKQFLEGNSGLERDVAVLKQHGTDIELYDWQPNRRPSEFQRDLMRITREWYARQGLIR